jgi:hypothetical protein
MTNVSCPFCGLEFEPERSQNRTEYVYRGWLELHLEFILARSCGQEFRRAQLQSC